MNVRNVVKVMNFHSLLRVDKARRTAKKYEYMEEHLLSMIDSIMNNRNMILDKKLLKPREGGKRLAIYMGSDFGFCSSFNSQINDLLSKDKDSHKILIGKKLHTSGSGVLFHMDNAGFQADSKGINEVIIKAVEELNYSSIVIVYNHYVNTSLIEARTKQVFPVVLDLEASDGRERRHHEDFVVEGDINRLLKNLVITYVNYEVMLADVFANAAENLMRQNATTESLKRIDELEEEKHMAALRERRTKEFGKVIESFIRMKGNEMRG